MPGADSLIPGRLGGEWVEANSDEHGCKTKALRRVLAGHGKEQQPSIGAMGAEIDQLHLPDGLLTAQRLAGVSRRRASRWASSSSSTSHCGLPAASTATGSPSRNRIRFAARAGTLEPGNRVPS